jgi:small subunit ribosomal protein S17
MAANESKARRILQGIVISDKMEKTVVVQTSRTVKDPRFYKYLNKTRKYKVHDEKNIAREGDLVEFYEGRPLSKTKYMYLARVMKDHSLDK